METKIETNVPLPDRSGDATRKYPFNVMDKGDSFALNGFDLSRVRMAAFQYGKKHSKKFTVRKTDSGHRCWRTE